MKSKSICVFCSSSNSLDPIYFKAAEEMGELLGKQCFTLVYGGSNVGLMKQVAESTSSVGGKRIGIIPKAIYDRNVGATTDNEQIITANMRDRKYEMRKRSNAFVALPGGFGTLEEILEVITLKQLHYHNKPIVFVNTNNFYSALLKQFEASYDEGFAKESYRDLYFIAQTPQEAMDYIVNYREIKQVSKW